MPFWIGMMIPLTGWIWRFVVGSPPFPLVMIHLRSAAFSSSFLQRLCLCSRTSGTPTGKRSIDLRDSMLALLGLEDVLVEIGGAYCGAIFRTLLAFCGMQYLRFGISLSTEE